MDADAKKKAAALAALEHVEDGMIVGVGTGSTVNHFIAALKDRRHRIAGAVVGVVAIVCAIRVFYASKSTTVRALAAGVPLVVAGQIALGLWVVASLRQVPVVVGHFAGAAMLWSLWILMTCMTKSARD